jgi:hemophore-related protein
MLGIVAAGLGAAAVVALPSAGAAPEPCSAAGLTSTISSVNTSMSQYLEAHPDVNTELGNIATLSPWQAQGALTNYFNSNPTAANDIRGLQQPLKDLSAQCGFQVTPGQVLLALEDI